MNEEYAWEKEIEEAKDKEYQQLLKLGKNPEEIEKRINKLEKINKNKESFLSRGSGICGHFDSVALVLGLKADTIIYYTLKITFTLGIIFLIMRLILGNRIFFIIGLIFLIIAIFDLILIGIVSLFESLYTWTIKNKHEVIENFNEKEMDLYKKYKYLKWERELMEKFKTESEFLIYLKKNIKSIDTTNDSYKKSMDKMTDDYNKRKEREEKERERERERRYQREIQGTLERQEKILKDIRKKGK